MFTIRTIRLLTMFLIAASVIAVLGFSSLWHHPAKNAFLFIFISAPFVLFIVPIALAKRQFACFINVGFLAAAAILGIVNYYGHGQAGPEIPTMYFAIPIIQTIFALFSIAVASIDFFTARRYNKRIA